MKKVVKQHIPPILQLVLNKKGDFFVMTGWASKVIGLSSRKSRKVGGEFSGGRVTSKSGVSNPGRSMAR